MPRISDKVIIDESAITKGQIRKLNALRKSVGEEIGEKAFLEWLETQDQPTNSVDHNVEIMTDALNSVRDQLRFPRGGAYIVKQGRGSVLVEPAEITN